MRHRLRGLRVLRGPKLLQHSCGFLLRLRGHGRLFRLMHEELDV